MSLLIKVYIAILQSGVTCKSGLFTGIILNSLHIFPLGSKCERNIITNFSSSANVARPTETLERNSDGEC